MEIKSETKIANARPINKFWEVYRNNVKRETPLSETPLSQEKLYNLSNRDWATEFNFQDSHLGQEESTQLYKLLDEYQDVCSKGDHDLGKTTLVEHHINTEDARPIRQPLRRINPAQRPIVDQKIAEMLEQGVIVPSSSPWVSPVVIVAKKGPKDIQNPKDWRLCIDYRRLNDVTVKDQYPLPRCDESLEYLSGNKYFSALDLVSGYYQVPMSAESAEKTAFAVAGGSGLYQYTVISFGLCNAPSTYQRLMETVLRDLLYKELIVYIDDILLGANSFPQMLDRLRLVFDRLRYAGLKIKPQKCRLFLTKINFLGHTVSAEGISQDPAKVEVIKNWPTPTKATEIHSLVCPVITAASSKILPRLHDLCTNS